MLRAGMCVRVVRGGDTPHFGRVGVIREIAPTPQGDYFYLVAFSSAEEAWYMPGELREVTE